MKLRIFLIAALVFLLPDVSFAATFLGKQTVLFADASSTNVYLTGGDVRIATATPADLSIAGGTLSISAPVGGDALLFGGSIDVQRPVKGDVRAVGGSVVIEDTVGGDVVALGGAITVSGHPKDAFLAGGTVALTNGASGPVTIYGAGVLLAGTFEDDVRVTASDHITLAEGTIIKGSLVYDAPQQAEIPASATIGSVEYTGSSSFLPTNAEAKTFAVAGAGVFLVVSVLSAMLLSGLVAGLFPDFTQTVAQFALRGSLRRFVLTALLGFAAFVATPVFILLLLASFVGMGVAMLAGVLYLLLLTLSYVYAAVLAGSALARSVWKRETVFWRDVVLGMLVLQLIGRVPGIGPLIALVLSAAAAGTLLTLAFRFAFKREGPEEL
ncbi:MAG: hypothetical protein ABA06_04205 [Parcubacteria bacterium C7867-001]|nr:MAG: hypothetical protein ABA06_04205 [Parcubacteria bacterium C7867-001]